MSEGFLFYNTMFYLYILYSALLDKFYVGSTSNIEIRLKKHLSNHKGFTSRAKDWKVTYMEEFESKVEAQKREKQIKNWKSRKMIRALVAQDKV